MKWTSIKDKLPTPGSVLIVTVQDKIRCRRELRYPVSYMEHTYTNGWGFYVNGCEILLPEYSEVVAWMPLPEPFEEETE